MEQTQRRQLFMKTFTAYNSWEEIAFTQDHASLGFYGGCLWPPRSYSCSFCKREFRSAQALGGHMNVHRTDRAKLKQQSPLTTTNTNIPSTIVPQTTSPKSLDSQNLSYEASNLNKHNDHDSNYPRSYDLAPTQKSLTNIYHTTEFVSSIGIQEFYKGFGGGLNSSSDNGVHEASSISVDTNLSMGINCIANKQKAATTTSCESTKVMFGKMYSSSKEGMIDLELRLGESEKV